MHVKFRTNLGRLDAESLGIDFKQCCLGETIEVSDAQGEKLVKSGVATDVTPPKAKPEPKQEPKPASAAAETTKPGK